MRKSNAHHHALAAHALHAQVLSLTFTPPIQVEDAFFSLVHPTPAAGGEPRLVAFSPETAQLLDLDPAEAEQPEFALIMAGAASLPGR